MDRWATFDCYGTLVDWNAGLAGALGDAGLLARYHEVEPVVQAESPGLSYREVLRESARRLGVDADPAETLPGWPVFDDVRPELGAARSRGWRLAILSNSDRDLIAASQKQLRVPIDLAIVAEDVQSYKPAHAHWERFFEATTADRDSHAHVAASLFHDIAPARELGLKSVWINRLGEQPEPKPDRELTDLSRLPDTLDELVAP
jgi:2-haloacid dehalogenase